MLDNQRGSLQNISSNEEANNSVNETMKKRSLIWGVLIGVIVIFFIVVGYYIEKSVYFFCHLILFYWPLAIILQIILHGYFLRYIVIQVAFAGQCKGMCCPMKNQISKSQAILIIKHLTILDNTLESLNNGNRKDVASGFHIRKKLEDAASLIYYYYITFQKMEDKFHSLTKKQRLFFTGISNLNSLITTNNVIENITMLTEGYRNSYNVGNVSSEEISNVISLLIIQQLSNESKKIISFLDNNVLCTNLKWYSLKKGKTFLNNDTLGSLNQFRVEFENIFDGSEYKLITKDKSVIDYVIIHRERNSNQDSINDFIPDNQMKSLMIICGPNGAAMETFSKNIQIENYLNNGIEVLGWNYRGYGYSTGTATFNNGRSDIGEGFESIKLMNKYDNYGVHGISIGGIPACHLAGMKVNDNINGLVSDRNFGCMDYIAKALPYGNILYFLYKCLILPSSVTINDYMNANCFKIVGNDCRDGIVRENSSLKTLTSKYIVHNYLLKKEKVHPNDPGSSDSPVQGTDMRELSTIVRSDNPSNTQVYKLHNNLNSMYKSALDLLLDDAKSRELFLENGINISRMFNNEKLNNITWSQKFKNMCSRTNSYNNIQTEIQDSSGIIDFIKGKIEEIFETLESAGDTLSTVGYISEDRLKRIFLIDFFNNFLVWGNKLDKNDDVQAFSTVNNYQDLSNFLQLCVFFTNGNELESVRTHPIFVGIVNIIVFGKQMERNLKLIGIKKIISSYNATSESTTSESNSGYNSSSNLEDELKLLGKGNGIALTCGHNGAFTYDEMTSFQMQLALSGFMVYRDNIEKK